jgi:serine O-acetyltransferase
VVFHAVLPYECDIHPNIELLHHGLGVVIHPNCTIGSRVKIGHGVTITAGSQHPGSRHRVTVRDGVFIGAGAHIAPRRNQALQIGEGATVGARAVVTRPVPPGATMVGPKATVLAPVYARQDAPSQ